MPLVDWQIRERCLNESMVTPFDEALLNPASLDVRVGMTAKMETHEGLIDLDLSIYTEQHPYLMVPGEFMLASTVEVFNIPFDLTAEFKLKSSRAREGYEHLLAGWADPGFKDSVLTIELVNIRRFKMLPIYPGLKIGQMIFWECAVPEKPYTVTGRYNGDRTVMASKG